MTTSTDDYQERAVALHQRALVVDTHCDTTQRLLDQDWSFIDRHDTGHVDLPRLHEGGVDALFLAIWAAGPLPPGEGPKAAFEQFDAIEALAQRYPDQLTLARSAEDVRVARSKGKVAILIGVEGGYLIDDSVEHLREYHRRGASYLTLTHAFHTSWADSSGVHEPLAPHHGGLTDMGKDVIRELNRLGMMVDISHASDACVQDALAVSVAPVIASHSSCRTVSPHIRNLSDELMRAITATGGVIQINFAANFVDPDFPNLSSDMLNRWMTQGLRGGPLTDHVSPLSVLVDHFEHAIEVVGADHVGIGTDFDGVPQLPQGMEDCSRLPHLTAELLRRGLSEEHLLKVLGANILRVMDRCHEMADGMG